MGGPITAGHPHINVAILASTKSFAKFGYGHPYIFLKFVGCGPQSKRKECEGMVPSHGKPGQWTPPSFMEDRHLFTKVAQGDTEIFQLLKTEMHIKER